jgi:hypothetical protein
MEHETYGAEVAERKEKMGALAQLDLELERYEKALGALKDRLGPILSVYDGPENAMKELKVEPTSHLAGRADQLADLTVRLERIIREIDL